MNWKNRLKNPYFWCGLLGVILSAMGVSADMFTSWTKVGQAVVELVQNPFMLGSVAMAVLGVVVDNGTAGLSDSGGDLDG